jgi:nucleotide-binding universal stress UspA family protein
MTVVPVVRRVVVGVDGSAESVSAMMWACREASLRGAAVDAVLAVEAACHRQASYAAPRGEEGHGSWGAARDVLRQAVTEAAARFPGITVRHEVAEGLAARVLLDRAAGADMLVLGRAPHAAGQEQHRGTGPVIRACLRAATCPVVVIGLAEMPAAVPAADHVPDAWEGILAAPVG